MSPRNNANYVKWLLTDAMMDLVAAVGMARETIDDLDPDKLSRAIARLRVCNHSIIISLTKLTEIKKAYSKFLNGLPSEVTADFYQVVNDVRRKKIHLFRNKHAAHIIDNDTNAPISLAKGEKLLASITGKDNSECLRFYDWVYPEGSAADEECVVNTVVALSDFCKGLPVVVN